MKKWMIMLCALSVALMMCACASAPTAVPVTTSTATAQPTTEPTAKPTHEPTPEPTPVVYDEVEAIDFYTLLEEVNAREKAMVERVGAEEEIKALYDSIEYENLVTDEEMEQLKNGWPNPSMREILENDKLLEEIDLLRRLLKTHYGAYEYFGGDEAFDRAFQPVYDAMDESGTSYIHQVGWPLSHAFDYIRDGHFRAPLMGKNYESTRIWEYAYAENHYFAKDDTGFYKYINGEKWYYDSSTDPNLRLEPSLLPSGKLVYAPIRFTYIDDWQESCVLTLKNGDQIRTEEVLWVRARSLEGHGYDPQDGVDYQYWMNEQNVGYVSVRSFDPFSEERNKLDQFVETGKSLRKADVIVYDVRSNSGGGDGFPSGWYENFAGTYPQYPFAGIGKNDYVHQEGLRLISAEKGKYIENDIPILVLADYRCASAGESALSYMRTLNNSIRIGTNSAGCELCGNTEEYQLPYTRITLTFGRSLDFDWDGKNIDGIGYEPDIWCDGAMAYEATMNMIEYYGISKESLAEAAGKVE